MITLVATSFFVAPSTSVHVVSAAFNPEINYQGRLLDAVGDAVADDTYNMQFKLHTALSGGSVVWTETHCYSPDNGATCNGTGTDSRVETIGGLFSVMLGSINSLADVDFNQELYLSVNIGGVNTTPSYDGEMTPRKVLGTVPAAFVADTLDGIESDQFFRNDIVNATSSATTSLAVVQNGAGKIAEFFGPSYTSVMSILSTGNVGVGTTTPGAKFSVAGNGLFENVVTASSFVATSTTATSTIAGDLRLNGALLLDGLYGTSGMILQSTGTGTTPVWTATSSLGITVSVGIGSSITSGSSGSVLYVDSSGNLAQDQAGFRFYDNTNYLSLGTSTGAVVIGDITGNARGTDAVDIQSYRGGVSYVASGSGSTALGFSNLASGDYSVAIGHVNTANGSYSSAIGSQNTASAESYAFGYSNTASGFSSLAVGHSNTVSTTFSSVLGYSNSNAAIESTVVGYDNTVDDGDTISVFGHYNRLNGSSTNAVVVGNSNDIAPSLNSFVFGGSNILSNMFSSGPLVVVGHGNNVSNQYGNVVGKSNVLSGDYADAFGTSNTASGFLSLAFGSNNSAAASGASAFGLSNAALSDNTSAFGYLNTASGSNTSAFGYGNTASGNQSSAFGFKTQATATGASVFGGGGNGTAVSMVNNIANSTLIGPGATTSIHILGTGEVKLPYFTATSTTATSTIAGNLRVDNNLQVGNSSIYIRSNATSTFDGGIDLSDGCFAIDGVCIGAGSSGANTSLSNLAAVAINTSLVSDTDNTDALGSASIGWSDLFLGNGGAINFSNGDVTLTQGSNQLKLEGGTLVLPDTGLQIGVTNPFNDTFLGLTLQNISLLDATTELTIESAIDTLSNLVSVGTISTGIWQGTAIADTYVADTLTISGGTINNTSIGATTPSTAVFTNATSTNATTTNFEIGGNLTFAGSFGTLGQVLTSNGAGSAPTWEDASGGGANTALSNLSAVAINTSLVSDTNNTDALGSASVGWSDLFLGSGAVVNFNNGDVTMTHASNALTLGGGDLIIDGNLGIGTTSPYAKLSVVGEVVGEYFTATSTTATSTFAGGLTVDTNSLVVNHSTGYVGIGNLNPSTKLHVSGNVLLTSDSDQPYLGLKPSNWTGTFYVQSGLTTSAGSGGNYTWLSNPSGKGFILSNSVSVPQFIISPSGNVGIGTTSPYAKLSVVGEVVGEYFTATSTTATSTIAGNLRVNNNLQVGNSSIYIRSNATSTFDGGIDLSDGCFAIDGVCIGAGSSGANTSLSNLAAVAINTSLISDTDNTDALGSASIGWSDLFLGSGAVVNFNNGDVTMTHAANALSLEGGILRVGTNGSDRTEINADTTFAYFSDSNYVLAPQSGLNFGNNIDSSSATFYLGGLQFRDDAGLSLLEMNITSGLIGNEQGNTFLDFRWETDTSTHGLFVDASANAVGIGTAAPSSFMLQVAGSIGPNANDGGTLGSGTLSFSDLFLASGGVVNFNNSDVTLTHTSNLLTLAGGNFSVGSGSVIGSGSVSLNVSDGNSYWSPSGLSFTVAADPADYTSGNYARTSAYFTDDTGAINTRLSQNYLNFGSIQGTSGYGIRNNAGTIEFKNSGGSWTPFGSLSSSITSSDFFRFNHFENTGTTSMDPFTGAAISSGTLTTPLTTAMTTGQTPGVVRLRSSTSANGGYRIVTTADYLLLDDNMMFEGVMQLQTSTNVTVRLGFHDSVTSADAVDGAYFEIVGGTATGKTSNNSVRSSTASNYALTAGAANWYRFRIVLNSTASTVTYSIYNLSGTQLWTDTLSTNIPTTVGRATAAGIVATESSTTAFDMVHVDYMGIGTVAGYDAQISSGSGLWTTSGSDAYYNVGKIGVGTSTPSGQFSISQSSNDATGGLWIAATDGDYRSIYMGTDQVLNFIGGSGNTATLNAAGAWTNASDIAYKENIETLDYGLEEIMLLNPRRYNWKSNGATDIGFIAQELEQVIPEVVFGADGAKTVSYGQLTSLAISGLQDIGLRIDLFDAPTSTPSLKLDADGKLIVNNDFTVQNEATFGLLNVLETATFEQGLQALGTSTSSFGGALLIEGSVTLGSGDITITANGIEATNAFAINESQFYVATTGAIGIGTTSPARMLHVVREGEGSPVRFQDANGYCEINPTTASLICTSDQSLKENITELTSASVLDQIRALKPVTFEWLSDESDTARVGFIAQDVELVIPELVYTDAETGLKSVAYGGFVPYLVSAMKELVMRVDTLGTQLETLTARVEELASQSYSATIGAFQNLRVGSPQQSSGITIYDEETGAPYCLTARNGSLVTRSGECGTPIDEVDQTREQHVFEEGGEGQAVVDDGASVNDDELLDIAPTSTVPELPEGSVVEPVLPELEPETAQEQEPETLPELEFDVEPEPIPVESSSASEDSVEVSGE